MQAAEFGEIYDVTYVELQKGAPAKHWRALLPWIWPVFTAPLTYLLGLLLALFPHSVELVYSRFLYKLQTMESLIFGAAPFSVGEIAVVAAVLCMFGWFIYRLIRVKRYPVRFVACVLGILSVISVCGARFTFAWGLNYHRATVGQILRLDVRERPIEELEELVARLAIEANYMRVYLPEDQYSVFDPGSSDEIFQAAAEACAALGTRFSPYDRPFPKAKPLLFSQAFSKMGISGIYNPLTAEANINVAQPKLLQASSACHELAHMAGFARENEANFLAFLATRYAGALHVRYSGTVMALIHAGNALYARDAELYDEVREIFSEQVERDLADHSSYWRAQEGPAQEAVEELNDAYLKSQGEKSGIGSYGEMVDLLLAFYEGR